MCALHTTWNQVPHSFASMISVYPQVSPQETVLRIFSPTPSYWPVESGLGIHPRASNGILNFLPTVFITFRCLCLLSLVDCSETRLLFPHLLSFWIKNYLINICISFRDFLFWGTREPIRVNYRSFLVYHAIPST